MGSRFLITVFLLASVLTFGTVATSGDRSSPVRQSAIVYLSEPTLIGSTIVQGPVLFTHDSARMKRGEPCTTVHLFEPLKGPTEEIAAFHCIPTPRSVARKFTLRTRPNVTWNFGCILTEYQFAGDTEAHGVPAPTDGL